MPDSFMKQCGDGVVTAIQGLSLSGVESTAVKYRKAYRDQNNAPFPGVTVVNVPEREAPGGCAKDDYGYGFLVVMAQGTGKGFSDDLDKVSLWRERIKKVFNNKRPFSVTGADLWICTWEPGEPFVSKKFIESYDVGTMVIRCWVRESRT